MHYTNGREAKLGDLVRGHGYNLKHGIVGIVVQLTPGTDTCNIAVATVGHPADYKPAMTGTVWFEDGQIKLAGQAPMVASTIENGQCDAFVALDPKTGDILAPVEAAPAPVA